MVKPLFGAMAWPWEHAKNSDFERSEMKNNSLYDLAYYLLLKFVF